MSSCAFMLQIHLLDPWWNPATEDQAMDRVHRIGQQRAVDVWRYACNDSIEERILALQVRHVHSSNCSDGRLVEGCGF